LSPDGFETDLNDPGSPILYSIGPNPPENLGAISDHLAVIRQQVPDVKVVVRADRRIRYEHVRALMQEVARNDITALNVAAIAAEDR
jgi:biopolymer transport protein ExbD